jgi:hypothetical protein
MNKPRFLAGLFLLLLIGLELWIFSGSFNKYFNLDSAFYVIHCPHTWGELCRVFQAPDPGKQYRPLTLAFMALVVPVFRLDPRPYHWIPLIFHLANTLLVYGLARRLLKGTVAALAATIFWGLHSVAGWVTYDTTCVPDFMLAFLVFASLTLAVDGFLKRSLILKGGSVLLFVLALLTKEAAVAAPLALAICLVLAHLKAEESAPAPGKLWNSIKKAIPLTSLFLGIALAYAGFLISWLRAGMIYTQGKGAAYNINPWSNLLAKAKYFFWALNLPDYLYIPHSARWRLLASGLMGLLLLCLLAGFLRRRGRMEPAGWAGLLWLAGMNLPALMLSDRVAKWYLYIPLLGLSLTLGTLAQGVRDRFSRWKASTAVPAVLVFITGPILLSSVVQNRSYLSFSDASYSSDVLQSFTRDLQSAYPVRPDHATVLLLPSFEPTIVSLLASPPVNSGGLLQLQFKGRKVRMLFAHKGERLSHEELHDPDVRVIQNLNERFYDVTGYYRPLGKMTLYVLPTSEGKAPPLLQKEPAGGRKLYDSHVKMLLADEGACLPDDFRSRQDLWILQYLEGHFTDVTAYYKGRRQDPSRRIITKPEDIQASVSRDEYYPSYSKFATPTGAPVFFPTPQKEIVTQVGGSTITVPLGTIPREASLRFDISWMFDIGDGGWAEMRLRSNGAETVLFREYMHPNPAGSGPSWREVGLDLRRFQGQKAELILRCYNDKGKNTIADWLNWRDMVMEASPGVQSTYGP